MRLLLAIWIFTVLSFSTNADDKVNNIIEELRSKNRGFLSEQSEVVMTLDDGRGNSVQRELSVAVLEASAKDEKSGIKTLVEFLSPIDVKGSKFLSWNYKNKESDQWLFLPSLKRVKKISGKGQSGSFMGSEFTYEDIAGREFDQYESKLLEENDKVWVIEQRPKQDSGYSRIVVTFSRKYFLPENAIYYNKRNEMIKKAQMTEWREVKVARKTFYRSDKMIMENLQTKKSSTIEWKSRLVGKKIDESLFNSNRLKR